VRWIDHERLTAVSRTGSQRRRDASSSRHGLQYVERLRNHALSPALMRIMAAVVGVIANLAIYFAIHALLSDVGTVTWGTIQLRRRDLGSLQSLSLAVAAFAAILVFRARWSVLRTLGACALVGLVAGLVEVLAT
jgi:chromate transporter